MAEHTIHVTITGDANNLVEELQQATERLKRDDYQSRAVYVRQRAQGVNLSVDISVGACTTNLMLPPNLTAEIRTDHITIGGYSYGICVAPRRAYVTNSDITFYGRTGIRG